MEYKEIVSEITNNKPSAIYFLTGEEPYFIDKIVDLAETQLITLNEQDFNLNIFYGKDINAKLIAENCRQFPLLGDKKLVIVKEAQEIKDKDWEGIETYLKNPSKVCTLIIAYKYKKPDGRLAWVKQIKDKAVFFESKEIKDYQLPNFISDRVKELNLRIEPEAALLMAEYIGNNCSQIANELSKLKINIKEKELISTDHIQNHIGISKEFNVFELQKALTLRDNKKIYYIAKNMGQHLKPNQFVMVVGALFNHFTKLWLVKQNVKSSDPELSALIKLTFASYIKEYRDGADRYSLGGLEKCLQILKNLDLKSKGIGQIGTGAAELLLEMAVSFTNV